MRLNVITIAMIAAAVTSAAAAEQSPTNGKPASSEPATATSPPQPESPKPESSKPAPRRCMVCGATCGLTPICICKPGTKKQPRDTYETACEPICVAGCGSKPWPFARPGEAVGCSSCCEQAGRCPGWVRERKTLKRETVNEEVPTIERRVGFICSACADSGCASARTGGGCLDRPEQQEANWWPSLARWLKPW